MTGKGGLKEETYTESLFLFSSLSYKDLKTSSSSSDHPANFLHASLPVYPAYRSCWGRTVSPAIVEYCSFQQVISNDSSCYQYCQRSRGKRGEASAGSVLIAIGKVGVQELLLLLKGKAKYFATRTALFPCVI